MCLILPVSYLLLTAPFQRIVVYFVLFFFFRTLHHADTTLASYLMTLDSDRQIRETISQVLGDTKPVSDFAVAFLTNKDFEVRKGQKARGSSTASSVSSTLPSSSTLSNSSSTTKPSSSGNNNSSRKKKNKSSKQHKGHVVVPGAVLGVTGNLNRSDLTRPGKGPSSVPQNAGGSFGLLSTHDNSSPSSSKGTNTAPMTKSARRRAKKKNKKNKTG